MKVSAAMTRRVMSCRTVDSLERATQLMWDGDIGCLPVIDDAGHVAGIITDRDVAMAAYTQGKPLRAISVDSAMARPVVACSATDELSSVEKTMKEHQIRRMPVLGEGGNPIGMITLNDIARVATRSKEVTAAEVAATLAAVGAPRLPVVTA